jgi:hypothetical protein
MAKRMGRWWIVVALAGLGLVAAVVVVSSASTATPQANQFYKRLLSEEGFAAYPDIATGENGLVVAAWSEGPGLSIGKHYGPVVLGWISNNVETWETATVDLGPANDVALAVTDSTAHVAWIQHDETLPKEVYYISCNLAQATPSCAPKELIAEGGEIGAPSKASQVDLALGQNGTIHVVWAEGDNRGIYYNNKPAAASWATKGRVEISQNTYSDYPVITTNRYGGEDYVHVAWAEQKGELPPYYHVANYCQWDVVQGLTGATCQDDFAGEENYPARNLSIAADGNGNIYVVWDVLVDADYKREYAIGYKHSFDNGRAGSWRATRTYREGNDRGFQAETFQSGEEATVPEPETGEYAHFLRPQISLAASGTVTVPVLAWHAQVSPGGNGEPELARQSGSPVHKVFWTYATEPASDNFGYMYWANDGVITTTDYITLSVNFCGEMEMDVNSSTARLAIVGDLNNVKDGGDPGGADHLHAIFHEEIGDMVWGVYYVSNITVDCIKVYLPPVVKNYTGKGEE